MDTLKQVEKKPMYPRKSPARQWDRDWSKSEYLNNDANVEGLIKFIVDLEREGSLNHTYEVTTPAWKKFLKDGGANDSAKIEPYHDKKGSLRQKVYLTLRSLSDAKRNYYWPSPAIADEDDFEDAGEEHAYDLANNDQILRQLSKAIKNPSNGDDAFEQAIRILDWGKTYRGSIGWLLSQHKDGELISKIKEAVSILDADTWSATNGFCDGRLRMDSGLTKVFSLASEKSVIYDSRVAAGLGLLVRKYLKRANKTSVPLSLQFVRSSIKRRNPSVDDLKFPLRPARNATPAHACSNLLANWLIEGIVGELNNDWGHRTVEASFFMIGYAVA